MPCITFHLTCTTDQLRESTLRAGGQRSGKEVPAEKFRLKKKTKKHTNIEDLATYPAMQHHQMGV